MAWWKKESPGYFGGRDDDGDDAERSCSNRRIVKLSCMTEEVEPGKFVRKCDKTEQLLRQCAGRPAEIVESKTEHTEDDVSDEVERGLLPFESDDSEPLSFPGLRSDLESIEREFLGGFSSFVEAMETMTKGLLDSFAIPSRQRSWPPLDHRRPPPVRRQHESRASEEAKDPYAGLDVEIREV